MKKTIYVLIVMLFVTAFGHSQASAASCGEIDSLTNTVVTCGNGSPEDVVNVWGTRNSDLPHIAPGQTAFLSSGQAFTCPAWFPMYCVDLTGTSWFKNR